jgi:4-amino-4-deoxy-L-arabinose transferase-like glycosyltransferase
VGTLYSLSVRQLILRHKYLFLAGALAALALRLVFLTFWPRVEGDSLLYLDLARNWLAHGIYGFSNSDGGVDATYIRLPGYPGFLALAFLLVGFNHLNSALVLQILIDVAACFVIAALAYETFATQPWRDRAAVIAFFIAALCPFTANYAALPLTESLEFDCTALAFLAAVKAIRGFNAGELRWRWWALSGIAIAACILLRPDGGLVLIAFGLYFLFLLARKISQPPLALRRRQMIAAGLLVACCALAPLAPWTLRNWLVFRQFHPLAPRYTTEPGEYVPLGVIKWERTWVADYVSVEDIGWKISADVPGEFADINKLPARAIDSPEQRARTAALLEEYNQTLVLSPATDAKFAQLADERIAHSAFRYYVQLPLLRLADMWLRPRTEMLSIEQRWWDFADNDADETAISLFFLVLNFLLVAAALFAAIRLRPSAVGYGLMLTFVIARSVFLLSIENPEPRYTLECYPVVYVFAAAAITYASTRRTLAHRAQL